MNLKQLHTWTQQLMDLGVQGNLPVTCLVNGWPLELSDALFTANDGKARSPEAISTAAEMAHMLALVPMGRDPHAPVEDDAMLTLSRLAADPAHPRAYEVP